MEYFGRQIAFDIQFGSDEPNIIAVGPLHPAIERSDVKQSHTCGVCFTLGLFLPVDGSVLLVVDRISPEADFYEVTLHEIGHKIGLDHVSSGAAIMKDRHTTGSAQCPTRADAEEFCRQHYCTLREVSWCDK